MQNAKSLNTQTGNVGTQIHEREESAVKKHSLLRKMLYSNNERVCATPRRNTHVHTTFFEIPFSIGYTGVPGGMCNTSGECFLC